LFKLKLQSLFDSITIFCLSFPPEYSYHRFIKIKSAIRTPYTIEIFLSAPHYENAPITNRSFTQNIILRYVVMASNRSFRCFQKPHLEVLRATRTDTGGCQAEPYPKEGGEGLGPLLPVVGRVKMESAEAPSHPPRHSATPPPNCPPTAAAHLPRINQKERV